MSLVVKPYIGDWYTGYLWKSGFAFQYWSTRYEPIEDEL